MSGLAIRRLRVRLRRQKVPISSATAGPLVTMGGNWRCIAGVPLGEPIIVAVCKFILCGNDRWLGIPTRAARLPARMFVPSKPFIRFVTVVVGKEWILLLIYSSYVMRGFHQPFSFCRRIIINRRSFEKVNLYKIFVKRKVVLKIYFTFKKRHMIRS